MQDYSWSLSGFTEGPIVLKPQELAGRKKHTEGLPKASDYVQVNDKKSDSNQGEKAQLLLDATKVASTLRPLQVIRAIKDVFDENCGGAFHSIVSRHDLAERVPALSGSGLNAILEKLIRKNLITPYRDQAIYGVTEKQQRLMDYVIEQWKRAVQL